jgi:hypothetical protein
MIATGLHVAQAYLQRPFFLVILFGPGPPLIAAAMKK